MLPGSMLLTLILSAALVSLAILHTSGPHWLQAVPEGLLLTLAILLGLLLLYRLGWWLYRVVIEHLD